jgi:hypothetical protein
MVVGFTTTSTKVVSSNPAHGEVYSIQLYVIKFVSDLRQVGGFLKVVRFPSQIKLTATIINITETLLKVALNTLTLYLTILECCVKVNFKSQKRKTILEDLGKFILILTSLLIGRRLNMPNDNKMM